MHRNRWQSIDFQLCRKSLGTKLRLREDKHLLPVVLTDQMGQQRSLPCPVDMNE
jgi:hypothetical protein